MAFSSLKNKILMFLVCGLLLLAPNGLWARDDIMLLKDVKVGMKGFGKTVIHGRDIETFSVEVMGVLANNKINENLLINGKSILVRVSGKVIDDSGGIAAGMSGSPVYVNNKLIGGLSSGWVMTDHTIGMVTPIEEMLEIWDYPLTTSLPNDGARQWYSTDGIIFNGKLYHSFWEVADPDIPSKSVPSMELCGYWPSVAGTIKKSGIPADDPVFLRVGTPLMIQGLGQKAANLLGKRLHSRFVDTGSAAAAMPNPPAASNFPAIQNPLGATVSTGTVEPGSAIGVQLARGDINLTTLGTLTYRDNKKILGFAHPFLKKGNVSFLLVGAHIYHSFSSVQMPFKIGAPTEILGTINQDREKGISGEIGKFPVMVPIQIDVTDKDLKRSRSINYQIVRDPTVFCSVIESTFVQALEGIIDRDGEGTALLGIALDCVNSAGTKLTFRRENMYYSKTDIMNTLTTEVNKVIESCIESEAEEIIPTRILLKIDIEQKRGTMTIEKVEVKNSSITPGGVLEVWVTLKPFRDKSVVKKMKLLIPSDIGKEDLRLTVYGLAAHGDDASGAFADKGAKDAKKGKESKSDEPVHENFEAMMKAWVDGPQNSELLFQLTPASDEDKKIKLNGRDHESLPTNLVILGSVDSIISLSED